MSVARQILGCGRTLTRLVAFGLVLGALTTTLSACGQKGPLYLPDAPVKDTKTQTPAR